MPALLDICPECNRRRTAVCPICRTAGSNFPPGDFPVAREEEETAEPPLLICPTCDEPFEPRYLRRCEWCGHDFGEGIAEPERPVERPSEPLNPRIILAALAALALLGALMAYFAKLLR